jgi:hypothetical protein
MPLRPMVGGFGQQCCRDRLIIFRCNPPHRGVGLIQCLQCACVQLDQLGILQIPEGVFVAIELFHIIAEHAGFRQHLGSLVGQVLDAATLQIGTAEVKRVVVKGYP